MRAGPSWNVGATGPFPDGSLNIAQDSGVG